MSICSNPFKKLSVISCFYLQEIKNLSDNGLSILPGMLSLICFFCPPLIYLIYISSVYS